MVVASDPATTPVRAADERVYTAGQIGGKRAAEGVAGAGGVDDVDPRGGE